MLKIEAFDTNNNYRILNNDAMLFHDALRYVLRGEKRFHVRSEGTSDFDLVYVENDAKAKADSSFPDSDFFRNELIFPPYFFYDETDLDRVNTDLLEGFDELCFEEVNEYSVVIARLALAHTDLRVTFKDERVRLFADLAGQASVAGGPVTGNAIYVQESYYPVYDQKNHFDTIGLFHCLFLLQWITDLPAGRLKYVEFTIRKTEGIGSILSSCAKVRMAFGNKGIRTYISSGCTRYSDELLTRYFALDGAPVDASEANTGYVRCFNCFVLNGFIQRHKADLNLNMLRPSFVSEMAEYGDAVLSDRKVLGVLLRGTDIVLANFAGRYHPAPMEDCVRIIGERMKEYDYDRIFVATEDSQMLDQMVRAFPGKVLAVSQERFKVSDFKDVKYISDLEKSRRGGVEYSASVEDTTINYFYAMYMLSRCESLIANCMCNGVNIAESFNQGRYTRKEIVSEMI